MQNKKKNTQHNKRIYIIIFLYQYFLEKKFKKINTKLNNNNNSYKYIYNWKNNKILKKIINHENYLIYLINKKLKIGWKFTNLKSIEQAILILATYEIIYTNLDKKIIINEAIILTKSYCLNNIYKYINAVLDKINKI